MRWSHGVGLLGLAIVSPSWARAACPDSAAIAAYVEDFRAGRPSQGFGKSITMAEAACARGKLTDEMAAFLGSPIGYKAVFTNPESQRRFGVAEPSWGVMFAAAMRPSGARLPAAFGARPRYESDFIVVVKDAALADARTPEEAIGHISDLVPFIELPDLMVEGSPTGAELVATNAAFRAGVLGTRIPVDDNKGLIAALADMEVIITDGDREVGRERGATLMGNPLNAAIWLARELKAAGVTVRPGDLLSLGGFLGSIPTRPDSLITIRYKGLPGDPAVTVRFD